MDDNKILVTQSSMPPYEEYIELIKPLWESHWLTNMGDYHNRFEQALVKYLQVPEVSLMVNGHMALEMSIQSMHLPVGSEVITTPFTFISTTHAIIRNGLVPVFCDIHMEDYTIDEEKIENLITEKTSAIIPVHVYGNICNVNAIAKIAKKYDLKVIYDAAHAFGELLDGVGIANFGDASIFSFHATKVFNTIEGGAACFQSHEYYERMYNLKNFGIRSEELVTAIGGNAKMNEFQAAMGLCNLKYLESEIDKRKKCYMLYKKLLENILGIRVNSVNPNVISNYAYFPILINEKETGVSRDVIVQRLKEHNIYSRKYFYPLTSEAACFKNKYAKLKLDNARYCADRILVLPMYADLREADIERICKIIKESVRSK